MAIFGSASGPKPVPSLDARGLPVGWEFRPEHELTPRQIRDLRAAGKPMVLIDCRRPEEYQTARIEGSVLIPLQEMEQRLADIKDLVEDAGPEATIAVHCHHGARSLRAVLMLQAHGVSAKSMAGGIDVWSVDIDPRVPRY